MGRCWLWGAGPPQSAQCSGGLSPGPFCVEFACSPRVHKGFPPLRTPTEKTCKITEHMSIPDQRWTVHFTWSPGAAKLPTAPGGSLRKDGPGWEKAENKFTATSGLPACVCVLCRLHICTCVFQCVVCAIKNLTKVLIMYLYTPAHLHMYLYVYEHTCAVGEVRIQCVSLSMNVQAFPSVVLS